MINNLNKGDIGKKVYISYNLSEGVEDVLSLSNFLLNNTDVEEVSWYTPNTIYSDINLIEADTVIVLKRFYTNLNKAVISKGQEIEYNKTVNLGIPTYLTSPFYLNEAKSKRKTLSLFKINRIAKLNKEFTNCAELFFDKNMQFLLKVNVAMKNQITIKRRLFLLPG